MLYRPFIFAAAYPQLIGEQYNHDVGHKVREDSQGTWVLQKDWDLHSEDFATCPGVEAENQKLSQLYWEIELGCIPVYPGIEEVKAYGW